VDTSMGGIVIISGEDETSGDIEIDITNVPNGGLQVTTGSSNDSIDIDTTNINGALSITTGTATTLTDFDIVDTLMGGIIKAGEGENGGHIKIDITNVPSGDLQVTTGNATSGDIEIDIKNALSGDLQVTTGSATSGDIVINITETASGNVNVTTGDADSIDIDTVNILNGNLDVQMGSTAPDGSHDIDISNTVGNINVMSGTGSHDIDIIDTNKDLFIMTNGGGKDLINITNTGGDMIITTSATTSGQDNIHILNTIGDQTITTGAGDDVIILFPVTDNTLLTIDTGDDNDLLKIDGLVAANADISCGSGNDELILNNATETNIVEEANTPTTTFPIFQRDRQLSTAQFLHSIIIATGDDNDEVFIKTIPDKCSLEIDVGSDDDVIEIAGLGYGSNVTILGGAGSDTLLLDGRESEDIEDPSLAINTMDGTSIYWNGGDGVDNLEMYFVSAGTTSIELFGDNNIETGENFMTLQCADIACIVLSRQTFCE
jgi:hypothetical protein